MSRHGGWVLAAVVVVATLVLGVVAPSSWLGVVFVLAVAGLMAALRGAVPQSYRVAWRRSTLIVVGLAACAGGSYAFAERPWGPRPVVAWPLFVVLMIGLLVTVADAAQVRRGGVLGPRSRQEAEAFRSTRGKGSR
ncbi:MAG TPA: hypothetical protein VFQ85_17990 [Mycobacteriales bacterium]|jgi:hypothetical protein|nr:hypothetical protein [Mycobacteriales bacterium]